MAGMTAAASLPTMVQGGASILQGIGGIMAGRGAKSAAEGERRALEFQAQQLQQNAGQAVAASQRAAEEERRKAGLVASRALAIAASSGGGASDVTVQKIISDIDGEGAYRAMVALYEGDEKARQLNLAAAGKRYEGELAMQAGKQKQTAYTLTGLAKAGSGALSLYSKYGRSGSDGNRGDSALISDGFDTGSLA